MKANQQQLRSQLKGVRDAIGENREERATALEERDSAKEKLADADLSDPQVLEGDDFKAAEQAVASVGKIDDKIADLQRSEQTILGLLGDGNHAAAAELAGAGADELLRPGGISQVLQGEAYTALRDSGRFDSRSKLGSVLLGEWMDREATGSMLSPFRAESEAEEKQIVGPENKRGATTADRRGLIPPALKPLTLLDLIPAGTTDAKLVEYVQIINTAETMAKEVAEGAAKSRLGLETVDAEAAVKTIAGYIKVKKPALEDVAGLQSMIAALLPYYVRRRLESQILVGDGTGENLKGLFHTTGIGAPAAVKFDNTADAILRAVTTIILADGDPNFVALNPTVWQELLMMRWTEKEDEDGNVEREGGYLYGSPSSLVAPTIWGLAITKNRVVPAATPLVGDSNAAQILVRTGLQLLISDNDADDFTRNRATVLAEMRAAFAVYRPASFAKANLA